MRAVSRQELLEGRGGSLSWSLFTLLFVFFNELAWYLPWIIIRRYNLVARIDVALFFGRKDALWGMVSGRRWRTRHGFLVLTPWKDITLDDVNRSSLSLESTHDLFLHRLSLWRICFCGVYLILLRSSQCLHRLLLLHNKCLLWRLLFKLIPWRTLLICDWYRLLLDFFYSNKFLL